MMSHLDEQSSSLPLDLWHHIIGYVLTCNTLAKLERVSKTLKSVTDTYWKILWEIENPNTKLTKNYRFACKQTHTKNFTHKYDQFCMYAKGPNINVLVSGNKAVGKSSLRHRICFNTFVDEIDETIEDHYMKKVWSKNKEIVLTVYDDTVEEDWVMLRDRSKRLAQGVFLVCSYDDRNGILEFPTFIDQLARVKDVDYHCLSIVILINKCDLEVTSKQFTIEEVRKIADSYKIKHVIEVSALTGQGTEEACVKLAGVVTDLFSKEPRFVGLLEAGKELHTISCWDPKYKSLDRKRRCIVA